jgi:hypothetical protein
LVGRPTAVLGTADDAPAGKGLKPGALRLLDSIVVGVASTAPAYSLAAGLGYVVVLKIAFYYGLTGFAGAWFYRRTMRSSFRDVVMQGALPLAGGVILVGFFVYGCKTYASSDYGYTHIGKVGGVFLLGVGSLVLGPILMVVYEVKRPAYFRGETLPRRHSGDLVIDGKLSHGLRLPDSGGHGHRARPVQPAAGRHGVDLQSGREVHLEPGQRYVEETEGETEAGEQTDEST